MVQYIAVPGGSRDVLSVFRQFVGSTTVQQQTTKNNSIWYSLGGFGCDCERSALKLPLECVSTNWLKNIYIFNYTTMTWLSKWQFCQLSRNVHESLGSACSSSLYCRRDALMWSRFERVKERRRSPAESLTLFSNDRFNLLVCVDLFTQITYLLYWISVCRNFHHYILESCGDE